MKKVSKNRKRQKTAMILGVSLLVMALVLAYPLPAEKDNGTRGVGGTITSAIVDTPPTLDGDGSDAVWGEAQAVTISTIDVELKSVYTDTHIYFLAEWSDTTENSAKKLWTFDTGANSWDQDGDEDRLVFSWNIDDNVLNFNADGCIVLCHVAIGGNASRSAMSTNAENEIMDFWHWKAARSNPVGYADDKWLGNDSATDQEWNEDDHDAAEAAHHGDSKEGGHYSDNKQELSFSDDPGNSSKVPIYWEPDATGDDAKSITNFDIDSSEVLRVDEVFANGTLYNATEDIYLEPDASTEIPGYTVKRPAGSRGDIEVTGVYAGGKWTLEIKRALDTTNSDDIQFDDLSKEYSFSVALFDDSGGISHSYTNDVYKLAFEVLTPPSAVTNVQVTEAANGTVALSWDMVTDAVEYNVYYSTSPITDISASGVTNDDNTTSTTLTVDGLTDGTKYYFAVTAVNSDDLESSLGDTSTTSATPVDLTPVPPDPVAGLTVTDAKEGKASLNWNAVSGAVEYKVYYSTSAITDVTASGVIYSGKTASTTHTMDGLADGTKYFFAVTAVDSDGLESSVDTGSTKSATVIAAEEEDEDTSDNSFLYIIIGIVVVVIVLLLVLMMKKKGGKAPTAGKNENGE
jgi:fibronectin type 3 domain-containing protein/preprotein translocase subunit SecG